VGAGNYSLHHQV